MRAALLESGGVSPLQPIPRGQGSMGPMCISKALHDYVVKTGHRSGEESKEVSGEQ